MLSSHKRSRGAVGVAVAVALVATLQFAGGAASALPNASVNTPTGAPIDLFPGTFDSSQADQGLVRATGTTTATVYAPQTNSAFKFSHNVRIVGFKSKMYAMWQASSAGEDEIDGVVNYATSTDYGATWSAPMLLAPANIGGGQYFSSSGSWWTDGNTLVAYIGQYDFDNDDWRTFITTSTDGTTWSAPVELLDDSGTAFEGAIGQSVIKTSTGRLVAIAQGYAQNGSRINIPYYTDDASGLSGWQAGTMPLLASGRDIEPAVYEASDGAYIVLLRDQSRFTMLASRSIDGGATWTKPVQTNFTNARNFPASGNLPDGRAYIVSTPTLVQADARTPLALTLSNDGVTFDRSFLLRGASDHQARRFPGLYKCGDCYSYPSTTVWNGFVFASYATNKEDVEITRVPIASLPNATSDQTAPTAVNGLVGATSATGNTLTWSPSTDASGKVRYLVYRGAASAGSPPLIPSNFVAQVTTTSWSDVGTSGEFRYVVVAQDPSRNTSLAAEVTAGSNCTARVAIYDGSVRPTASTPAWTWSGAGTESSTSSVSAGNLTVNSTSGQSRWTNTSSLGGLSSNETFKLDVRARVTSATGEGLNLGVNAGSSRLYNLSITTTAVRYYTGSGFATIADQLDNAGAFHTYELVVNGGAASVLRDGSVLGTFPSTSTSASTTANVFFGKASSSGSLNATVDSITYRAVKSTLFEADTLPSNASPSWSWTGARPESTDTVASSGTLALAAPSGLARWSRNGLTECYETSAGIVASLNARVTQGTGEGLNFTLNLGSQRMFNLSITPTALRYYNGTTFDVLASGLDNASSYHVYDIAVQSDGSAVVRRDGVNLGVHAPVAANASAQAQLSFGKASSSGSTSAVIDYVRLAG